MNKIIITGATGFIGQAVVRKFIEFGYEVGIFCREDSNLKILKDFDDKINIFKVNNELEKMILALKTFKPDCVIHIASYFIVEHKSNEVKELIESNIKFPSILLEAMNVCAVKKFINTGTSWQHYKDEEYNPVCLYAATKESFEKIIDYYVKALEFKCITLKLFDSYGENDNRGKLISLLKDISINNKVLNMSKGDQKIDLTHVNDIALGFYKGYEYLEEINYGEHKKYALCTGKTLSLKEVIKIFESSTGYKLNINWGRKEYRTREVMEPWSKYEILPNWTSTISFEKGVKSIGK